MLARMLAHPVCTHAFACVAAAIVAWSAAMPTALAQVPPDARAAIASLEQALAAQPEDGVLAFFLGLFKARAGDADGALEALERTVLLTDGFLPPDDVFASLKDDPRFVRLKARFERRLPRRTDGKVVATLRDRLLVPEGIAYDPVGRAFYVGSIARRAVYRVGRDGAVVPLSRASDALDEVLGIAVDGPARRLYAVSTSALTDAGRASLRNAIKAYDVDTRKLVATFDVPGARQLNDVAVAPGGVLYVSDSAGGGVWRIDTSSGAVSAFVALDTARSANGIAVAPGGEAVYVAAGRRPLHVDARTGAVTPLALPPRENAAAIDGLYWHDGALIGIQNLTTPARVVRLVLAADGKSVTAVETLQSHHQPAFVEPTTGAVAPDGFHVLARTYVTRYGANGRIDRPQSLRAPLILRVPLTSR